ncbi:unnamed protein product, partial [Amoebophrya sp. A120]
LDATLYGARGRQGRRRENWKVRATGIPIPREDIEAQEDNQILTALSDQTYTEYYDRRQGITGTAAAQHPPTGKSFHTYAPELGGEGDAQHQEAGWVAEGVALLRKTGWDPQLVEPFKTIPMIEADNIHFECR